MWHLLMTRMDTSLTVLASLLICFYFSEAQSSIAKWWWISNLAPWFVIFVWFSPFVVFLRPKWCLISYGRLETNHVVSLCSWLQLARGPFSVTVNAAEGSTLTGDDRIRPGVDSIFVHVPSYSIITSCSFTYVQQVFLETLVYPNVFVEWRYEQNTERAREKTTDDILMTIALSGTDSNVVQLLKQTTMPPCQLFELDMWAPGLCTHHCCALRLFKSGGRRL